LPEIKAVSETADWKQKYRDSLRETEAEEKRWREVEQVLRRLIGRLCAAALRAGDFVARIGGEEFAVLLHGLRLPDAVNIANQVRTAVQGLRFHFRGTPVRITASCGITELTREDASEQAFDRADAALYRAKSGGKNLCIAA
jgi:diguanylate cyclase